MDQLWNAEPENPPFIVWPAGKSSLRSRSTEWRISHTGRRTRHFGSPAKADCGIWWVAVSSELSSHPT